MKLNIQLFAVPFRKVSKTSGRMRRTHYKLVKTLLQNVQNVVKLLDHIEFVRLVVLTKEKKLLLKKKHNYIAFFLSRRYN